MNEQAQELTSSLPGAEPALAALTVDPVAGELQGPGGVEHIDPKVMEVFTALLAADGEVVSRETLLDTVWAGAAVTDDVLTRCVYALRGHLATAGGSDDYRNLLVTLPKRGYRLFLELRDGAGEQAGRAERPGRVVRRTSGRVLALGIAMALAAIVAAAAWWLAGDRADTTAGRGPDPATGGELAIAVLPFVNMSADPDQQYFADGLSEELINLLANILDIRVIARTSSFSFRGSNASIATIGEQLGVTHVLEGSVRRDGDRVRVTAQLIETARSGHLWSETYDRDTGDTFGMQDEIAAAVADALNIELATARQSAGAYTADPLAHEAYLRGRFLYHRRDPGDVARAQEYFEEAVRIDPQYALAWANLAGALNIRIFVDNPAYAELQERHREAVEQALATGPELAEAHARAARYFESEGEKELARQHFAEAVALEPDNPLVLGFEAGAAVWRGDFPRAIDLNRRAHLQDPLSAVQAGNLASVLLAAGQGEEAEAVLLRFRDLHNRLPVNSADHMVDALVLQRRHDEALDWADTWLQGNLRTHRMAIVLHGLGRQEAADEALARLGEIPGIEGATRRADVLAYRGDIDACLEELDWLRLWLRGEGATAEEYRWGTHARTSAYLNTRLAGNPRWQEMWLSSPMLW